MRVFILCDYPFPEGMAPTNRIFAYSKGLNFHSIKCEVLTFTELPQTSKDKSCLKGIKDGVTFYRSHSYNPEGNKLYRVFVDLRLFKIKAINCLLVENKKEKIDLILISFDDISHLIFFVPILRLLGFTLGFISDEFPPEIRNLRSKIKAYKKFLYNIIHKAFSFRITMTRALKDYYNTQFGFKPTYILNTVVDVDKFVSNETRTSICDTFQVCYMGNMELKKDNIDNIITAISLLKNTYPNIVLHLYGTPNKSTRQYITQLVRSYSLEEKVEFKGRINFENVPKTLTQYNLLVSSQPKTIRASGGFPTKLGEYMMSEVPTLVTDVGEISEYVKDEINVFLVPPEDPIAFANKIKYIIDNYDFALKVAANAKKFIISNFSYPLATKGLSIFLKEQISRIEDNGYVK